ncbi:MAG: SDR family NAD(P)-dependent oxidoreductase [Myxococcales bacterium FL481]|nr:MAG: SDR family NAD(P)-dependent oxidoreductase [Myxococcales bacterium FL481]
MTKTHWTATSIGDQTGRVVIVTGANSGIGFEAAKALARNGAHVLVASRSTIRGRAAVDAIAVEVPQAKIELALLDLADLRSVRAFSDRFVREFSRLDILINNAGVMMPAKRQETVDGFELQIGTNHLGHFALTLRLLPVLAATAGSRVVNVSSSAQNFGRLDLEDLHWTKRAYARAASYGASKIANMLFTLELQRRLQEQNVSTLVSACHPGWTATNLQDNAPLFRLLNPLLAMKPWQGALPTLYAAVAEDVVPAGYYGPDGLATMRGYPAPAKPAAASLDAGTARRLWELSEQLVGEQIPRVEPTVQLVDARVGDVQGDGGGLAGPPLRSGMSPASSR